ncbi:prephenate dehydrogenase [Actinocorallia longicatena]|uniref:Prephenate dehydrogenase n=1 Tax=Actinocorallia longicatena TaxID=111803 RepID=A0ABP6QLN7_9ACTN
MKIQRVVVVGTGLIGTSVALAVREKGAEVFLSDRDPASLAMAVELGAGTPLPRRLDRPADLAVIAVPPAAVAAALKDLQKRGVARFYTDVASVKARPVLDALKLGCDLATYVPGHPLAGRERSGPAAARGDLFLGRPWALCPTEAASGAAIEAVTALAEACGAEILTVDPVEHDRAVALVSHGPHVVSAAMAARLGDGTETALGLAGQGVRDVTRIAASDPDLWIGILTANAEPVAAVLDAVAGDLALAAAMLRAAHGADADVAEVIMQKVGDLLSRGNQGVARIPGKHGGGPSHYAIVSVLVPDSPGELSRLFHAVGEAGVNIEDLSIEHSPGLPLGVAELSVKPEAAEALAAELRDRGWSVPVRSES